MDGPQHIYSTFVENMNQKSHITIPPIQLLIFSISRHNKTTQLIPSFPYFLSPNQPSIRNTLTNPPLLSLSTGNRQKALPPHRQTTTRHRRRLPRRHQRTTRPTTRSPPSRPTSSDQRGKGEEDSGGKQEEGRKGEERGWCVKGSAWTDSK